jgi:hypothetical protein
MFVGEQRYVEDKIKNFMEYYRKTLEEDERTIFKNQVYIKGMKHARPGEDQPKYIEEDLDEEENKKFDREVAKSSSEDESHEQDDSDDDDSDENNESAEDFSAGKQLIIQKPGDEDIQLFPAMPMQVNVMTPQGKVIAGKKHDSDEDDDDEDEDDEAYANSKRNLRLSSAGSTHDAVQTNSPSSKSKLIEKNAEGGKGFKGDAPSLFNRSRLKDSTMKLDYDDDGEGEMKYRL